MRWPSKGSGWGGAAAGLAFAWALVTASGAWAQGGAAGASATGTLVLEGAPDRAEVFVDGEWAAALPAEGPLRVAPGTHALRVTKPGFTEFTDVVRVRRGKATTVRVEMLPVSMLLKLRTDPAGAQVFVGGKFAGDSPVELDLVEGPHELKVTKTDYRDVLREITARAGESDVLDLKLELLPVAERASAKLAVEPEWYEEPMTWLLIGGGAAILATGVVLAVVLTSDEPSALDRFCRGGAECVRVP